MLAASEANHTTVSDTSRGIAKRPERNPGDHRRCLGLLAPHSLTHLGQHHRRTYRVRPNAVGSEFARQHLRGHHQAGLGRAVRVVIGQRGECGRRRDGDDRTAGSCGDHRPRRPLPQQRGGTQIHRDRGVEQSGVGLDGRLRMRDARVVHQNVESAERHRRRVAPIPAGRPAAARSTAATLTSAAELVGQAMTGRWPVRSPLRPDSTRLGARRRERARDVGSDALRGTGDQSPFAVQAQSTRITWVDRCCH